MNGMVSLGMKMDRKVWKKYICEKIQEGGRQSWKNGFNDTEGESMVIHNFKNKADYRKHKQL